MFIGDDDDDDDATNAHIQTQTDTHTHTCKGCLENLKMLVGEKAMRKT